MNLDMFGPLTCFTGFCSQLKKSENTGEKLGNIDMYSACTFVAVGKDI